MAKPKWVRPDLRYKIGQQGYKIYEVKASKLGKAAFKTLIKQANERLRQIENRNLTSFSKEYQLVKYYSTEQPAGKGAIYNRDKQTGKIRFSSDLNKFIKTQIENRSFESPEEKRKFIAQQKAYFINTLRNFLTAESSTVSGIKAIRKRAFETFKKNWAKKMPGGSKLTQDQYNNFWKMYRENLSDTKKDSYGYDAMITLMNNSNIMTLPPEQIQEVMQFAESSRNSDLDGSDFVELTVDMFPNLKISL